jgi:hypothetical protein
MQVVDPTLAEKAGVPIPKSEWDRHHYDIRLPGFGGSDSIDWTDFLETLNERGYSGPYVVENEASDSKQTGDIGAIVQGFRATALCLAPRIWPLAPGKGFEYDAAQYRPLDVGAVPAKEVPLVTMDQLA